FKTNTAGTYTISINEVDGLFTDVEQNIYLKDNVLNSSHDLRNAPYSFATEVGVFENRFEIVYQAPLSVENPVFENGVVVYSKNQVINVNSGVEAMASVKVYDIRGRLLTEKNNVNATTTTIPLAQVANQVLIVQITATNGQTVSRKVVH
ncbi:MAG TPA: T9SS sorting signal type C domain-containing protein, partial [Flavobacterium sp.]|nr:T9SS sorting signal type C domain-containing protein [Flavobacterium sp.]